MTRINNTRSSQLRENNTKEQTTYTFEEPALSDLELLTMMRASQTTRTCKLVRLFMQEPLVRHARRHMKAMQSIQNHTPIKQVSVRRPSTDLNQM